MVHPVGEHGLFDAPIRSGLPVAASAVVQEVDPGAAAGRNGCGVTGEQHQRHRQLAAAGQQQVQLRYRVGQHVGPVVVDDDDDVLGGDRGVSAASRPAALLGCSPLLLEPEFDQPANRVGKAPGVCGKGADTAAKTLTGKGSRV